MFICWINKIKFFTTRNTKLWTEWYWTINNLKIPCCVYDNILNGYLLTSTFTIQFVWIKSHGLGVLNAPYKSTACSHSEFYSLQDVAYWIILALYMCGKFWAINHSEEYQQIAPLLCTNSHFNILSENAFVFVLFESVSNNQEVKQIESNKFPVKIIMNVCGCEIKCLFTWVGRDCKMGASKCVYVTMLCAIPSFCSQN